MKVKYNKYELEMVDRIPKGFKVWAVNFKDCDFVPLVEVIEGTYNVNTATMKAINIPAAEDRAILQEYASLGDWDEYIKKGEHPFWGVLSDDFKTHYIDISTKARDIIKKLEV